MRNPNGGGTVILGVAWYDAPFFEDRKETWFGAMHQRIYESLGILPVRDVNEPLRTAYASG
ncbi:hypothetical protein [Streptomyces sp. NPDC001635]